jgi:hypothetical protein
MRKLFLAADALSPSPDRPDVIGWASILAAAVLVVWQLPLR